MYQPVLLRGEHSSRYILCRLSLSHHYCSHKQANRRMALAVRASLPDKETDFIVCIPLHFILSYSFFKVRVHVIEGRKLAGVGINPLVKVTCGSEVKGTSSRKGTSSPLFDEVR